MYTKDKNGNTIIQIISGGIIVFIKSKWKSVLTLVVAMAITMTAGYIYGSYQGTKNNEDSSDIEKDVSKLAVVENEDNRNNEAEEGIKEILPNTEIVFNRSYKLCKDVISEKRKPYIGEIGTKEDELQSLFPGWTIEKFTEEQLILSKQIDNYCSNHYILKEQGGLVTIYAPLEEDEGLEVIKYTTVKVNSLPPALQQEIEKGVAVESIEQIEYLIESWQS